MLSRDQAVKTETGAVKAAALQSSMLCCNTGTAAVIVGATLCLQDARAYFVRCSGYSSAAMDICVKPCKLQVQ